MKNLLLALLIISSAIPVLRAQTPEELSGSAKKERVVIPMGKGNYFLGLNGMGGFGNGFYGTNYSWAATGQGGYFIANRFVIGAQLSYGQNYRRVAWATGNSPVELISTHHIVDINPELFARYYFTKGKVKPFLQVSTGWNFTSGTQTFASNPTASINENNFTAKAALGVSFKLGKRMGLDLMYNRSLLSKPQIGDYNGFRLGLTFITGK